LSATRIVSRVFASLGPCVLGAVSGSDALPDSSSSLAMTADIVCRRLNWFFIVAAAAMPFIDALDFCTFSELAWNDSTGSTKAVLVIW